MTCRRRIKDKQDSSAVLQIREEELDPTDMTASSDARYLWPLPLFHPCNVLSNTECIWNAGTYAPASILLDLGAQSVYVARIELLTEMMPAIGKVKHQIRTGLRLDTLHSVCWYHGVVHHNEWIQIQLTVHDNIDMRRKSRYIQIITHESPSWVAWRRIRVWKSVV